MWDKAEHVTEKKNSADRKDNRTNLRYYSMKSFLSFFGTSSVSFSILA